MPIPTDSERIGTTIDNKYRVDSLIGKGGMGTVFRATHTWTKRAVALKILQPQYAENDAVVLRFLREARAAASFRHPNVVEVLDMGSLPEGGAYMALSFLEGEPLSAVLARRTRLTVEEAFAALLPVMRALGVAHSKGIVHRDLKPDNLFLARNDEGAIIPTLLDFGIAKISQDQNKVTTTGVIFGTPQYMSPEQARGISDIDGRADEWSIAAVWFECLTGEPPFDAPVPTAIIAKILSERAPRLLDVRGSIAPAVAECIDRALDPDRTARYPSMDAFVEALLAAAAKEKIELSQAVLVQRRSEAIERTDEHRSIEGAKTLAASEMPTMTGPTEKRASVQRWSLFAGAIAFAVVVTLAVSQRAHQAQSATPAAIDAGSIREPVTAHASEDAAVPFIAEQDASTTAIARTTDTSDAALLVAVVPNAPAVTQRDPAVTARVGRSASARDAGAARAQAAQSNSGNAQSTGQGTNGGSTRTDPPQTIGVSTNW